MSKVRVVLNRKTVRWYLKGGGGVAEELARRARAVASAAGPGMEHETATGRNRARATIRTATIDGRKAEATDRVLSRALDAGR